MIDMVCFGIKLDSHFSGKTYHTTCRCWNHLFWLTYQRRKPVKVYWPDYFLLLVLLHSTGCGSHSNLRDTKSMFCATLRQILSYLHFNLQVLNPSPHSSFAFHGISHGFQNTMCLRLEWDSYKTELCAFFLIVIIVIFFCTTKKICFHTVWPAGATIILEKLFLSCVINFITILLCSFSRS